MRFAIRPTERRNLAVGFIGLLAIMTAHSVMETARDALFLSSLPATDLPWAYLAIAILAILELKIHERVLARIRDRRALLAASLLAGSFVTFGFWALLEELGPWAPFGFYVWTGLLITVVLIEFWLLLDDAVTVSEAKRIFPAIAAGGVTGAMLGSLMAETLLRITDPPGLVVAAATILASAACAPFLWKVRASGSAEAAVDQEEASVGWLLRDNYLSRLLLLVMIGTITLTVVDYVFKSTVADNIASEGLGQFFARFYLGLNSIALIVHLVGAGWLLRGFGAHRSSALLPMLIMAGAAGLALGPVLLFAVALKAFDGSLRHTLYRSSVEVLYLPLDSRRRDGAKGIIEVFGHRVGQAIASVVIMAGVGLGLTNRNFGIVILVTVAVWLATIMSTRRQYVDQFRHRLRLGINTKLPHSLVRAIENEHDDVRGQLREQLLRVVTVLRWRASIENGSASGFPDSELLQMALREKEHATLERSFRLMGLKYPEENFALVWRGLRSKNVRLHAASVEVLEAALTGAFREAVLALVDEGETPARRARVAAAALGESIEPMSYDEAMKAMAEAGLVAKYL
jgi:hypothetical protein